MMAENKGKTTETTELSAEETELSKDPYRLVKIKVARDKTRGSDIYVNVNTTNYHIQRGAEVEVPYFIAEVIRNSVEQDEKTAILIEKLTESAGKF